jgi:formylglycine-generating enzyme required for sulfatase activity
MALHQLGDLEAARHHDARLAEVLETRLAAAEADRHADALDVLMPLLARTALSTRAAELSARWHSGAPVTDGDTKLALVRVDQRWVAFGRTEVTRGEYAVFARDTGRSVAECRQPGIGGLFRSPDWRDPGFRQADTHPVVCVSRDDAIAYARWLSARNGQSYRLPTASEWLAAARRAVRAESPCRLGNLWDRFDDRPVSLKDRHDCSDGFAHTSPAGRYPASADGLSDLVGNVAEWTTDTVRGTSFRSGAREDLVATTREQDAAAGRTDVGFRLVRDVTLQE